MEVIKSKDFKNIDMGPLVLAVGTFDGVHIGHQEVIKKAVDIAKEKNLPVGVYTFNPHPLKVLKPAIAPRSIISSRQKIELLSNMGLNYYLEQKFSNSFAEMEYKDFVKDFLIGKFRVVHLVVGEDFHLGKNGKGDVQSLSKYGVKHGFKVTGLENITRDDERISSTRIRELIKKGKVDQISDYLGRKYRLDGTVIKGMGRGHKFGIPTANLKLDTDYQIPQKGVYACYVYYKNKQYCGIVNLGYNPTFANNRFSIEVHILNFDKDDIYGEWLSVELIERIRDEMTFDSTEELVARIKKDILYTESLLCYN
ncbi:MAG: bifunctional riboflavin kinase/FAD synthetase [Bacillota bacterium]